MSEIVYTVRRPHDMHPVNRELHEAARDLHKRGFDWHTIEKYARILADNAETAGDIGLTQSNHE